MSLTIILALIIISLVIIGIIVVRKFSILANIDLKNIESEKQAAVKKRIISEKLQRQVNKYFLHISRLIKPGIQLLNRFFSFFYKYLLELKDRYSKIEINVEENIEQQIETFFVQAQDAIHRNELTEAENIYIKIIGLDSKNFKAFQLLGELYLQQQQLSEAEQTFQHAIKLKQGLSEEENGLELAKIYYELSQVFELQEDYQQALENISKALQFSANNPRYLDKMITLAILANDKVGAQQALKKMKEVNPENNKIVELAEKIAQM